MHRLFIKACLIVALGVAAAQPTSAASTQAEARDGTLLRSFKLIDGSGKRVTEADLVGKPTAIFFGFTSCPDVCPTTLAEMTGWIDELGPDADRLNFVFVSLDPERDGPAQVAAYVSAFDKRIRGLTGTEAEIMAVVEAFKVVRARLPTGDGGYTIGHTASIYLLDENGWQVGTIEYGEKAASAVAKLRHLATLR